MPFALCNYTKSDGILCHSPALRNKRFCYFHIRLARRTNYRSTEVRDPYHATSRSITVTPPNDRAAIQSALGEVLCAIAANRIDTKRASVLLYGLQLAVMNVNGGELGTATQQGT